MRDQAVSNIILYRTHGAEVGVVEHVLVGWVVMNDGGSGVEVRLVVGLVVLVVGYGGGRDSVGGWGVGVELQI